MALAKIFVVRIENYSLKFEIVTTYTLYEDSSWSVDISIVHVTWVLDFSMQNSIYNKTLQ